MKIWYKSKIIWVNIISLAALILQAQYGFVVEPELQATILVAVNVILRAITKEEIIWTE